MNIPRLLVLCVAICAVGANLTAQTTQPGSPRFVFRQGKSVYITAYHTIEAFRLSRSHDSLADKRGRQSPPGRTAGQKGL